MSVRETKTGQMIHRAFVLQDMSNPILFQFEAPFSGDDISSIEGAY